MHTLVSRRDWHGMMRAIAECIAGLASYSYRPYVVTDLCTGDQWQFISWREHGADRRLRGMEYDKVDGYLPWDLAKFVKIR